MPRHSDCTTTPTPPTSTKAPLMALLAQLVLLGSCGGPMGEPTLFLTISPANVSGPEVVTVKAMATRGDGSVGKGNVIFSSSAGSLTIPATVPLDSFGSARVELICDPTTESACATSVRVTADWTVDKVTVTADARPRLNATGSSGTGGGTGSQDGDGGVTILSNRCGTGASRSGPLVACCYPTGGNAPTCGWSRVAPQANLTIPFTLIDGGSPNTLAFLQYQVPDRITDASQCVPTFGLFVQPGGLQGSLSLACYGFRVFPDNSWQLVSNSAEGCGETFSTDSIGNYFQSDCRTMMSTTDTGSVRLMNKAIIDNSAGRWLQSDSSVYVIFMHK